MGVYNAIVQLMLQYTHGSETWTLQVRHKMLQETEISVYKMYQEGCKCDRYGYRVRRDDI